MREREKHKTKSKQEEIRELVLGGLKCGFSQIQIAKDCDINPSTVHRIKIRNNPKRRKGSGRPTVLTPAVKQRIKTAIKGKFGGSVRKIARDHLEEGLPGKRTAIRDWVSKQTWGQPWRIQKACMLSNKNIEDRKKFCHRISRDHSILHPSRGLDMLNFIMFTDEANIYLHPCPNKQNIRIYSANKSDAVVAKWKGKGQKLCVAAGITMRGMTKLFIYPKDQNLNSTFYCASLLPFYANEIAKQFGGSASDVWLQEDGHPAHRSKASSEWKQENFVSKLLSHDSNGKWSWPGNSPDLNPIEQLWERLQECVHIPPRPQNLEDLQKKVLRKWKELQEANAHIPLIESWPQRIRECGLANGHNTRF